MRCTRVTAPASGLFPGPGPGLAPDPDDGDDGIHVASVTPFEGPAGAFLRVVVSWHEAGTWTERTVTLPTVGGPASPLSDDGSGGSAPRPSGGEARGSEA